jgi:hypothetical protein
MASMRLKITRTEPNGREASFREDISEFEGRWYVFRADADGNIIAADGPYRSFEDAEAEQLERMKARLATMTEIVPMTTAGEELLKRAGVQIRRRSDTPESQIARKG